MKPIVSFTLFGSDMKYYVGAEKNITELKNFLPDWEVRIYYHSNNIIESYVEKLSNLGATLINVKDLKIGNVDSLSFPYFWRFLSFFEDTPSIVRDLDSRFSIREVEYIKKWINSEKDYFIIRDHPWHSPVPSGLFGIRKKIISFEDHFKKFVNNNDLIWGSDQTILQLYMQEIDQKNIFYCGYDNQENYIKRDNLNFFIGMQINEFDEPITPSAVLALNYLKDLNL